MQIGWMEIVLIVLVILLLFGAKRIPELMRNLGKGVKSFKDGIKDVQNTDDNGESEVKKNIRQQPDDK